MSLLTVLLQQLSRRGATPPPQSAKHPPSQDSRLEQGFTLLECLMAIAIISLTVVMVTPPLFVATATRVQNRRAEQAFQLAQGEIDRIQVLVEKSEHYPDKLPAIVTGLTKPETYAPPSAISAQMKSIRSSCGTYTGQQIPANTALKVDIDGDCETDFLVQIYRTQTANAISDGEKATNKNRPTNFQIGLRVYAAIAGDNNTLTGLDNPVRQASLQLTSGQGSQRKRPLAVFYSNITWSDQSFALCNYQTTNTARACD
ncbi:type II secretion system protein [Oculatella sp. LEGE 06141]|uniref:prepilin-type N-terminal cleavage/methylation domain-containing protein n=1 Tax=Oculatella sp. LEGE 06141 TaxID=1828648 RepID=UPI00187E91B5|nr:prepilin-type N-terminal cleavage/methylation domain-containing protein [Oculatella sp. LEGE 06141]MBE9177731.1 type II secretion system protein [Oculatella sp. LEGE 06141]